MTTFLWSLFNHDETGAASIDDIMAAISYQLIDLGHDVERHDMALTTDGHTHVNIVVEGFDEANTIAREMERAKKLGGRFIILATERPGPVAFNGWDARHPMAGRLRAFPYAAALADAIWTLVPGSEDWYRQFNPNVAFTELGWSATREKDLASAADAGADPIRDFVFFGLVSDRRRDILRRISKRASIWYPQDADPRKHFIPFQERDVLTRQSRVVLAPKQRSVWHMVSNSRFSTALHLGRPIIAEPHTTPGIWPKIVRFSRSHGSFIDEAVGMLPDWRGEWARQAEAFRDLLPPARCVGAALLATGI